MEIIDNYKTIKSPSTGEYKEKGSKFIAYAVEINNEKEFKKYLEKIKKDHFKARHHCFAFAIGSSHEQYRHSDDGEPNGTAGLPIYNQIRSYELANIGIIVVRYFGGTKLGVPGLIRAYKTATKEALDNGKIIIKYIEDLVTIEYDYNFTGEVMKTVNNFGVTVVENTFNKLPGVIITVRSSKTKEFIKSIFAAVLNRDIEDIKDNEKVEGIKILVKKLD
jgi:uncharacterized YigZ family protein